MTHRTIKKCPKWRRPASESKYRNKEDTTDHIQPPPGFSRDWQDSDKFVEQDRVSAPTVDANTAHIPPDTTTTTSSTDKQKGDLAPPAYSSLVTEGFILFIHSNSDN